MTGTCQGCGMENVEVNEQGLCAACAAKQAGNTPEAPATGDTPATPGM